MERKVIFLLYIYTPDITRVVGRDWYAQKFCFKSIVIIYVGYIREEFHNETNKLRVFSNLWFWAEMKIAFAHS